jgi:divalent metal cation (Fe/Co/Zn/Cd) transporter
MIGAVLLRLPVHARGAGVVHLCMNSESRDYLLGHGRALSLVSLGLLLLVLTMTVVGWAITY